MVSFIIPVFNSADILDYFYANMVKALSAFDEEYEVIFVNDGSSDSTSAKLKLFKESGQPHNLKIVELAGHCGQGRAVSLGIEEAGGDIIVILDDDEEHYFYVVNLFLSKIREGYDVVLAWRRDRKLSLFRRFGSVVANALVSLATGRRLHDLGAAKVFGHKGAQILRKERSLLRALGHFSRLNIAEIGVLSSCNSRSRYNLFRLIRLFLELILCLPSIVLRRILKNRCSHCA